MDERNTEKQQKTKKKGDLLLTLVLIIAIAVFCYAAFNLFHIYTEYKKGTDEYNHIEQMAVTDRAPDAQEVAGPEAQPKAPINVDFASLKSVNPDVVGWIYVEALNHISYPIVQGKDNETYLHQTYEGNYNFAGTLFIDYENSSDFNDCNTLVYGHNMKNGSMFGHLKKFAEDQNVYNKSKYFWILITGIRTIAMRSFLPIRQVWTVTRIHCLRDRERSFRGIWRRSKDTRRSVPIREN